MEEKCLIQPSQQLDKYTYITFLHDRISKNNGTTGVQVKMCIDQISKDLSIPGTQIFKIYNVILALVFNI